MYLDKHGGVCGRISRCTKSVRQPCGIPPKIFTFQRRKNMKSNTRKLILLLCAVIALTCLLAACAKTYTVTYANGNENATGTVPAVQEYKEGDTVTTIKNPFTLANSKFDGWSDGTNVYKEGETFAMPANNVTLTAQWSRKILTVAEALALCSDADGWKATERVYVAGKVKSILNAQYGQMIIQDDTGEISVYGTYGADGELRYSELSEKPYAGDYVVLFALLQNFKGSKEISSGWIVEFTPNTEEIDISDYTAMSIGEARTKDEGTKVMLEGVVASVTYAFGMKPSGFYLVDGTNSIYVYDSQLAPRVSVGNKVKIAAERTNWILADEQNNADKYGYKGCIQVANAVLVSNDNGNNEADFRWVEESTVKTIVDTPVTENITTTIFKVNALVKKVVGTGFTNYYVDDLDESTGSYVYTQCSGGDFAWLDEFDGKICTVYLSAINAKSGPAGCVWRFFPVKVSYDNFVFDESKAPQFAIDYYGLGQVGEVYQSDPAIQLVTSVSSELLGFENVTLSYQSDNTDVAYVETTGDATVFHVGQCGTATITVTAQYKTYSATATFAVRVEESVQYDALNVKGAIDAELESTVLVTGIVGPSLVNQVGFYLIDDSGVIAVKTDAETMKTLSIGDEVVVEGKRVNFKSSETYHGQTCLLDSKVLANYFGNHSYSRESFVSGMTVSDFHDLDVAEDKTTTVYTMQVTVIVINNKYYTNIQVGDGTTTIALYCSSANQYAFLKQYDGQQVTVEIAPCNWNEKSYYTGCVLSVTDSEGNTIYNQLNFSND